MTTPGESDFMQIAVKGYQDEQLALRLLADDVNDERRLCILASQDGMHAYAMTTPGSKFVQLNREEVMAAIAGSGVVFGVSEEGVTLYLSLVNGEKSFAGCFEIASGKPVRNGEDGTMEFHVQPTGMDPKYDRNDDGGVDFKQLNLIENCFAGQRVASILPPGQGRPGRDVFGAEILPAPGAETAVTAGPGVRQSSNGRDFTSEIEGRLVYEEGKLAVSPLLEINHDIDYSVGNVDFVGKVIIRGALLDGFYVSAKKGVELHGDVGAGRINSEGDVTISGGIKGKSAAMISCRSLSARYIDDAAVEATGNVVAAKEIINSSVKALGRVTVASGAIIGGEVCGFQGVEADTLGSDMGVNTHIMSGLDWTKENKKDDIRRRIAEYMERVQSAKMVLDRIFADKELSQNLSDEHKTVLSDISAELRDIREAMSALLEERARIDSGRLAGTVNQINVRKKAYTGVLARFADADNQIKDSIKGPVSLVPGARVGMETKPLTPLPESVLPALHPSGTTTPERRGL